MATDEHNGNGNGGARSGAAEIDQITLTYDPLTDQMDIGGKMFSLDRALMMFERATRVIEQQWRLMELAKHQQNQMEQARVQALLRRSRARG